MFEEKYSRLKFWIISISLYVLIAFLIFFAKIFTAIGQNDYSNILRLIILIISFIWINTLANRIRDYGSNPWIALFSMIPLVNIVLALYYGIVKTKNKEIKGEEKTDSNLSLTKAVYNHTKDIASEIKPTINEYKEKHSTTKNENQTTKNTSPEINEDEIYEKIMIEIEEDKKVKSTWAKALAQSDGDKNKAEAIYIKLRFETFNEEKVQLEELVEDNKKELYEIESKRTELEIMDLILNDGWNKYDNKRLIKGNKIYVPIFKNKFVLVGNDKYYYFKKDYILESNKLFFKELDSFFTCIGNNIYRLNGSDNEFIVTNENGVFSLKQIN